MSTQLPVLEHPDQVGGSVWSYVSASRLNCWLACPLKWKLRYLDGIKTPTTPSLFVGKICHSGLEVWYRHRQLGVTLSAEDVAKRMVDGWDKAVAEEDVQFEAEADEMAAKLQAVDLVAAYLAQVPKDEPRPLAVEVAMEVPLVDLGSGEDLGIPLVGIVDLILDGIAGAKIVDFKTAARGGALLEISHEIQLTCYAYAYRHTAGVEEAELQIRRLIKTKNPQIETDRYPARTDAHFGRLLSVIREYLDALDSGRFNFRPGWGCGMCEHQDTYCRRWSG